VQAFLCLLFAMFQAIGQNVSMKQINALDLHKTTAEEFKTMLEQHDRLSIVFFGQTIGHIEKPSGKSPALEISLPELCRKSKRLLQYELAALGSMKVVSGQHNKEIVAHLIQA
jgi:hypothetical protein